MSWALGEKPKMQVTLPVVFKEKPETKNKRRNTHSAEFWEAHSKLMKLRWQDPEFRERHRIASSIANKARLADPEKKKKAVANFLKAPWKNVAASRLANAERFADPEERRKVSERAKKLHAEGKFGGKVVMTPEGRARHRAATIRAQNKRRGFAVPPSLRADYHFLCRIKKFTAREAGLMLGIIKVAPKQSIMTLEEYKVPKGELGEILATVANVTGVPYQDLVSSSRAGKVTRARMVFYYVAKTYCRHSYPKIGEAVNRDHSTVMSGCEKVRKYTEFYSPTVRRVLDALSREDKLAA